MANAMVRRGHRVVMHSPCSKPNDAKYEHVQVDVGSSLRTFRFAWQLKKINFSGFDVFHAHGDDYFLRGGKIPIHVRTMHGSCLAEALHVPRIKQKVRMAMLGVSEILATCVADATVCVSENTRHYYPWVRRVIFNGVDTEQFRPGEGREDKPTILFVGTYHNRKRGRLLMEQFAGVIRPAIPESQLWMVCGDAPAAEGVTAFGTVCVEKLAELYRRAWVFCLPSSYEGFGVPYIEAMASGTPVVATPNVGAREVLEEGKYGVVTDPQRIGEAIVDLLRDEGRRNELSRNGLERSRQYGWDTIIAQYEQLYGELMRRVTATKVAAPR
jgi:phosphatidyl-myo-inositol alpha-mannosyltransferase